MLIYECMIYGGVYSFTVISYPQSFVYLAEGFKGNSRVLIGYTRLFHGSSWSSPLQGLVTRWPHVDLAPLTVLLCSLYQLYVFNDTTMIFFRLSFWAWWYDAAISFALGFGHNDI